MDDSRSIDEVLDDILWAGRVLRDESQKYKAFLSDRYLELQRRIPPGTKGDMDFAKLAYEKKIEELEVQFDSRVRHILNGVEEVFGKDANKRLMKLANDIRDGKVGLESDFRERAERRRRAKDAIDSAFDDLYGGKI
jgi:hypothetical protein